MFLVESLRNCYVAEKRQVLQDRAWQKIVNLFVALSLWLELKASSLTRLTVFRIETQLVLRNNVFIIGLMIKLVLLPVSSLIS